MDIKEIEERYQQRLEIYRKHVDSLKAQRKEFLEKNPNHPYAHLMFMNVCAPPMKLEIIEIK